MTRAAGETHVPQESRSLLQIAAVARPGRRIGRSRVWRRGGGRCPGYREDVPLSDRDRDLLAFEARWQRHGAEKEEAVRVELGLTPARYYQLLGRLIDDADALAHDPMLVHRLRRLRDARERARMSRASVLTASPR